MIEPQEGENLAIGDGETDRGGQSPAGRSGEYVAVITLPD